MKKTWLKLLCNLDLFIASIAMVVLTLVTASGVIMRYVLKSPILWQEEVQAFCQVWMIFLGASVAFRAGSIVAIEMFMDALPEKGQKIMGYVIDMIVLFVLSFLMVKSHAYVSQVFGQSGRPTPILRIPYTVIYGVAPYGCALMMISYVLSKYCPKLIKGINIDVEADKEVEAQ
ncbi:MAG: TRAP transporter small permease [Clostridia bacterium]|nr:TRAP transporter small permease [Clostridia bacterium]